ncbi:hypothetical protein B0T10DRAFT_552542 [Thelonectria olida]|uniref:DUF6546 domain-containing protein n=1 Tax=Thelonectria olida TaxID=1576542 RepID=A0A9P8VUC8_9HYPO|nr:hypothetical protein B0T10DRAFT_552542 [Thelonectria olida]
MPIINTSWTRLPPQIRRHILDFLLCDGCGLARLATVSREWYAVIEPYNFARISLTPLRLCHSGPILHRKRDVIKYIWFRLELQQYDCTKCAPDHQSLWGLNDGDNMLITKAFQSLFLTLSQWKPNGSLMLDISIYSLSDSQHWFKYLDFRPDIPPSESSFPPWHGQPSAWTPTDDPTHGWVAGRQETAPNWFAIEKVFDEIMCEGPFDEEEPEMQWWQGLPSVPAITGILLRQQTRRRWKPTALANMLTRFPNLEEIWYEPWREWQGMERFTDKRYQTLIESLTRGKLRRLVVFENFNQAYPGKFFECHPIRVPSPVVSRELARASLQLEILSASFMVEARYFFKQTRQSSWTWQNLTALALTSRLLAPGASATDIDDMLLDAAVAALNMPKLETMEIWNGREGLAMLFRYKIGRNGQSPIITLRGTFELALRPAVARAWDAVALQHGHGKVVIKSSSIDVDSIGSHGDAICHLGLSTQVIRPVSLQQILKEHQVRAGVFNGQV